MKQDIILSFLFHFILIVAMVIITPFKPQIKTDLGEVINVRLASMPTPAPEQEPVAIEPLPIPEAVVADEEVAVVTNPKTVDQAKPVEKPKPKPEKPKEDKPYNPDAAKGNETSPGTKEGQKDVSDNLRAGSKFGSAAIDNASFDYPYWFVQAFTKIERNWSNPVFANRPLSCIIYFQVIRSGKILKIEVEQSSGVDAFDRACERAVRLSQPLPPLPNEFVDEIIGIHLEFPYSPG